MSVIMLLSIAQFEIKVVFIVSDILSLTVEVTFRDNKSQKG